jgi:chromatin modification-related protein VID21
MPCPLALFDKSKSSSAAIAKDERMDKLTSAEVRERTEARKRSSDHLWSGGEDLLLKSLCDRYPNNWRLICDSFNSSRIPTPGDKRSLWDCLERWKIKWGPSSQQPQTPDTGHNLSSASGMPQSPATEAAAISSMTRGARRMPSGGVPPPARIMTMALTPGGDDTKKRKHHMLVYDTVRRSVRKREAAAKTNGKRYWAVICNSMVADTILSI